jgi:hypothetical protein
MVNILKKHVVAFPTMEKTTATSLKKTSKLINGNYSEETCCRFPNHGEDNSYFAIKN